MSTTTQGGMRRAPFLILILLLFGGYHARAQQDSMVVGEYLLSGPYVHENLSVYLVHGKDKRRTKGMMTLAEAMRAGVIRVYETGDVNELMVENRSRTKSIFIQAGEIVKGGRQDRTLGIDLVLAPRSGRIPIAAYCVEQGRWSRREGESVGEFNSSEAQLVSRDLKLAARYHKDQSKVWANVKTSQDKLSEKIGERVNGAVSESSLQLALENDRLRRNVADYVSALQGVAVRRGDVVGCIFAVNGEMSAAEVYASNDLFRRSWSKLINAAAVEAVSEVDTTWRPAAIPLTKAQEFIAPTSADGTTSTESVGAGTEMITVDRDESVAIETRSGATMVRKSWIRK